MHIDLCAYFLYFFVNFNGTNCESVTITIYL